MSLSALAVAELNIDRFRAILETETDLSKWQVIAKMLAEQEAKLAGLGKLVSNLPPCSRDQINFEMHSIDSLDNRVAPTVFASDTSNEDATRGPDMDCHVAEAKVRADSFKRVLAAAVLGAGGVATVVWIAFLGWVAADALVVTRTLPASAPPSLRPVAVATPQKPGKGY